MSEHIQSGFSTITVYAKFTKDVEYVAIIQGIAPFDIAYIQAVFFTVLTSFEFSYCHGICTWEVVGGRPQFGEIYFLQ